MISLIVAFAENNRVIGNKNTIPWHIKEEFQHFKNYTTSKTILMGEQTFLSIGKPLPNRKTIITTLKEFVYEHEDVEVSYDLFEVLKERKDKEEELVICGGSTIYRLALPYVDKLIISEIKGNYEGDAFFPEFESDFKLTNIEEKEKFTIKYYEK